jgi:hypothetical protein
MTKILLAAQFFGAASSSSNCPSSAWEFPSMALGRSKQKPTVFLSFAGEDVEWKQTLMEPRWWAALTKVAEVLDYDDKPTRFGDLCQRMGQLVKQSSAFIVILSRFYIEKDGVIEHEFRAAADRFSDPDQRNFFRVIVIDPEAKQWWDGRQNKIFEEHQWLQNQIYWELIDQNKPALLTGDLKPRYARDVRDYAEKLAASVTASQTREPSVAPTSNGSIVLLGHPKATNYAMTNASIVKAREDLAARLRARSADVSEWEDGWSVGNNDKREMRVGQLRGTAQAVVRPLGPDEAFDAAVSPEVTANQLSFVAGPKIDRAEISKIKISLWLPSEHSNDPDAQIFVENARKQPASANPRLCVAAARELAELLVPSNVGGKITQISIEELDDIREIEDGRTARKIVEDELRECFRDGVRRANLDIGPPLVRQFLNYQRLANQIAEAKGGRVMLVAHDLQEHLAANPSDAHRMLGRKVRNLKESVEGIVTPFRGQLIPITLVVTNFENLRNDIVLDEEIAGIKWWLLSGQLAGGKFSPEPDVYDRIVNNIAKVLQEPGAAP